MVPKYVISGWGTIQNCAILIHGFSLVEWLGHQIFIYLSGFRGRVCRGRGGKHIHVNNSCSHLVIGTSTYTHVHVYVGTVRVDYIVQYVSPACITTRNSTYIYI